MLNEVADVESVSPMRYRCRRGNSLVFGDERATVMLGYCRDASGIRRVVSMAVGFLAMLALSIDASHVSGVARGQAVEQATKAPSKNGKAAAKTSVTGTIKVYDAQGNIIAACKTKVIHKPPMTKTNAFDFLRGVLAVDYTSYAGNPAANPPTTGGQFLNAIVGVPPDSGTYWALYVDGHYSCKKGITDYEITTNDILIEWKMEAFSVKHPECDKSEH